MLGLKDVYRPMSQSTLRSWPHSAYLSSRSIMDFSPENVVGCKDYIFRKIEESVLLLPNDIRRDDEFRTRLAAHETSLLICYPA